nr:transposase [Paenibacillus sp. ACRRX]
MVYKPDEKIPIDNIIQYPPKFNDYYTCSIIGDLQAVRAEKRAMILAIQHCLMTPDELSKHHRASIKGIMSSQQLVDFDALAFWEKYPAPHHLSAVGAEELAEYLRKASHNTCSTRKAEEILEVVSQDGATERKLQEHRDFLVVSMVHDMRRSRELTKQVKEELRKVIVKTDYKLASMDGINIVTAAELVAEIGDVRRFSNTDKLARFAGIAPVRFS